MLLVDLRQLREGPVETSGSLPGGDAAFQGLEFELADLSQLDSVLSGLLAVEAVYDAYRLVPGGGALAAESG